MFLSLYGSNSTSTRVGLEKAKYLREVQVASFQLRLLEAPFREVLNGMYTMGHFVV